VAAHSANGDVVPHYLVVINASVANTAMRASERGSHPRFAISVTRLGCLGLCFWPTATTHRPMIRGSAR
jgi:hypothetical protein